MEEVMCWYCPCKFLSLTMNYDWKRLFVGTVPANFCYWWALSLLTANFCHWPLTMELYWKRLFVGPCKYLSLIMNYDWKRLFVGAVPANICHWSGTLTGRGYLWVLSLHFLFVFYCNNFVAATKFFVEFFKKYLLNFFFKYFF